MIVHLFTFSPKIVIILITIIVILTFSYYVLHVV